MRRRFVPLALIACFGLLAGACGVGPGASDRSLMGSWSLTPAQIVDYFNHNQPRDGRGPCLTVSLDDLASFFVWEGGIENVRGDIAFAQAIVETGWFRYGGQVQCAQNNFGAIGATGGGVGGAWFSSADIGVRAQIQHLRAYADAFATSCTAPPLHNPCADPRFDFVIPKGKAPTWDQMGNGNWATDPNYGSVVIQVYNRMRQWNGLAPV